MRQSSLRLMLLALVAQVLRRWLGYVTTQLESVPARQPPREPADPRQPAPPDHWVELVRQHAPQLLEADSSDESGSSLVIDWRAEDSRTDPPPVVGKAAQARSPQQRPPVAVPTVKSTPKRPLRLEQIVAQALESEAVSTPPVEFDAEAVSPEFVTTTIRPVDAILPIPPLYPARNSAASSFESDAGSARVPEQVKPPVVNTSAPSSTPHRQGRRRGVKLPFLPLLRQARQSGASLTPSADAEQSEAQRQSVDAPALRAKQIEAAEALPVREIPTRRQGVELLTPHFSEMPFEQHRIRELQASIPNEPDVPTIRTQAGGNVQPHQRRTSVPGAPPQVVLRPTHVQPALKIEDVTADRWASLPDQAAEAARDSASERQRRERLKREQEGRAWSE